MLHKTSLHACCAFFVWAILISNTGCIKEYSYERQPVNTDTIPSTPPDTINNDTPVIYPQCSLCEENPEYEPGKWSFAVDTFLFCGNVSGAVMLGERTAFTFFGPSACSTDSGLIITAYFDKPFDTVATYVTADRVTLRYYNHAGTTDVFIAYVYTGLNLTIVDYSKATGIMRGIFIGPVLTGTNELVQIKKGKFEIQF